MKNVRRGAIAALIVGLVACGSQVVEFPECDCPVDTTPPNSVPSPVPTGTSTEDPPPPPPPPVDEEDAGQPEEDAGQPSEDAGQPSEDAGQPQTDGGDDPEDRCNKGPDKCGAQHGCCVSNCAHECNKGGKKHTTNTCGKYQSCFKACKAVCDKKFWQCKKDEECKKH